jgi:putative ABC transport system permease protein
MIPVKYNVRNLRVRWVTTLMTVIGTGLVVWASVLTFGMEDGLNHALRITGDKLDLIVLRKGSDQETSSNVDAQVARQIANLDGIAKDAKGNPICSSEYVTILTRPRRNNGGTTNLIIRGVDESSRLLRPSFKIVRGRDLRPGVNEAITSQQMGERFENLGLNEKLNINQVDFKIVGYFEASGSAAESEVWTDLADLTGARRTPNAISIVSLRARDEKAKADLIKRLRDDEQFKLQPVDERQYYEDQMSSSIFVRIVAWVLAICLTFGATFGAANTMFAAVASRGREIGALRALGFSRRSVLMSFLFESVLLCVLGGMLGCAATIPFSGLSTGTANWATFSEITFSFRFGPMVLLKGACIVLITGVLGGLFPAIRAIRMPITSALRNV